MGAVKKFLDRRRKQISKLPFYICLS